MRDDHATGEVRPVLEDPRQIDLVVGPGRERDNRVFGHLLAQFRQLAGLSRAAAAKSLDVSAEYLRLIELGRRTPAMGQMRAFLDLYAIRGDLGLLQPGGDRPDLILLPPNADEPITVDFTSRVREARRRGAGLSREPLERQRPARVAGSDLPSEWRAHQLGLIVSLLAAADDRTLGEVYDTLESGVVRAEQVVATD